MKYIGIRNREYLISETQMIGKGREGKVYRVQSDSGESVAIKLYSEDLLSDHDFSNQLEKKLKCLISKPVAETFGVFSIAWPRDLVYKEEGGKRRFVGYVQRIVDGNCTLSNIIRNKFPNDHGDGSGGKKSLTWNQAIKAAYNLAYFVAYLHSMGIILGDFNENNFLFNDKTGGYGLIDCGNYGLVDKTQNTVLFPSNFFMPNYRAPESILGITTNNPFSSDYFFLAVHIFNILTVNANPFRYVLEEHEKIDDYSIEDAIVNGDCLYVRKIPGKKLPEDAPTSEYFPRDIMKGFENTFFYTKSTLKDLISHRTTAEEWCSILRPYFAKEKSFVQYDYRVGINSPAVYQSSGDRLDWHTRQLAEQMISSYTRGSTSADYYFDRLYPEKGAELTRQGTKKVERYFSIEDLNDPLNAALKKSIIASINKKETDRVKLEPVLNSPSIPKTPSEKKPSQLDREKAEAVTHLIGRIGIGTARYTEEFETKLREARSAYNALTPLQKSLVCQESCLNAAEADYEKLKAQFGRRNKRVFVSLAINIVFVLLFAIVLINQTGFEWFITNSVAIAIGCTILLFSSTDLVTDFFWDEIKKSSLLGTIGFLLILIPIVILAIFGALSGTAPALYERIAEIDLYFYCNLAMALGLMFQSLNEFSKIFKFFQKHHASRKKLLNSLFYIIVFFLSVTIGVGFAKNYSTIGQKGDYLDDSSATMTSDSLDSKEKPHFYCYDTSPNYDNSYDFGPVYYQPWEASKVEIDYNSDICKEFFNRIEHDPVLAAAVFAYVDRMLGTRYTGSFYSEIQDYWSDENHWSSDNGWTSEINNLAKHFINDIAFWDSETVGFEKMLENSVISIEPVSGGDIVTLGIRSTEGQPVVYQVGRCWEEDAVFHYLCFTIMLDSAEFKLAFVAETGFNPVISSK